MKTPTPFQFKRFTVHQDKAAMKVGTDGVLLGAWCSIDFAPGRILDVGSGTGLIALMLAQRSGAMTIDAVEVDEEAYEQTVENFEHSDWSDRLFCYHSTFQDFARQMSGEGETYDLIVSNPPFYTDTFETGDTARNTARFTTALPFRELMEGAGSLLSAEGVFATIIPYKEAPAFIALATKNQWYLNRVCRVKGTPASKVKRSLLEFSYQQKGIVEEQLIIETARQQYTNAYKELTGDFYLRM